MATNEEIERLEKEVAKLIAQEQKDAGFLNDIAQKLEAAIASGDKAQLVALLEKIKAERN